MRFGVVQFPGSNCDADCYNAIQAVTGQEIRYVWHEEIDISDIDCIVLPGGFSYGDYLRCGAVARFSPVMPSIIAHAAQGRFVIGICNGLLARMSQRANRLKRGDGMGNCAQNNNQLMTITMAQLWAARSNQMFNGFRGNI